MKRVLLLAMAGTMALLLRPATGRAASNAMNTETPKVVIVSGGASESDLHLNRQRAFERFERDHPTIARDFRRQPLEVSSGNFRTENPEWSAFLAQHPAIRADIERNPGNYVVITPREEHALEHELHLRHMTRNASNTKA